MITRSRMTKTAQIVINKGKKEDASLLKCKNEAASRTKKSAFKFCQFMFPIFSGQAFWAS